ncbi:hypothetical protein GF351_04870 [Candidatus Woesearchaeota archaeon]|nr:hypothetical protein [Candidatus Woesearchaeota archaeon]
MVACMAVAPFHRTDHRDIRELGNAFLKMKTDKRHPAGDRQKHLLIGISAGAVLALDQLLKLIFDQATRNHGSLFGYWDMMWPSMILASVFLLLAGLLYNRIPRHKSLNIAAGIFIGGVASNLADRIARGYVLDYINPPQPLGDFNIADIGIWVGGMIIIIYMIRHYREL